MKSKELLKSDVPIISNPLITPITTDTRYVCINFIVKTVVNRIVTPPISITIHCQMLGTTTWKAGNNIGITIEDSNKN